MYASLPACCSRGRYLINIPRLLPHQHPCKDNLEERTDWITLYSTHWGGGFPPKATRMVETHYADTEDGAIAVYQSTYCSPRSGGPPAMQGHGRLHKKQGGQGLQEEPCSIRRVGCPLILARGCDWLV